MSSATLPLLARHEWRLVWRDALAVMTTGRRAKGAAALIAVALFAGFLHIVAAILVTPLSRMGAAPDKVALVLVTACVLLSWFVMLSQSMETMTRAFYARGDLDLILSSPIDPQRLFVIRIGALAVSNALLAMLIASPFVDVLVYRGGPRWLAGFGVAAAAGMTAAALAVAATVGLFRVLGPVRTRLAAQIVAAIIGASFAIGLQAAAILSYGEATRFTFLSSATVIDHVPGLGSPVWLPARAAFGDGAALAEVLAVALMILLAAILLFSRRLGDHVAAAASAHLEAPPSRTPVFVDRSRGAVLRRKEWLLLRRDPWLVSQTLLQVLYLLPAALLLWRRFGEGADALLLIVPVLVMAAGQLAGGLAWLSVSGEDAPALIETAPVAAREVARAKVEAVLCAVAVIFAPLVVPLAVAAPATALATAGGIAAAATAATSIQLWFRAQAKRSQLRRRHASSRIATFAEALSSISWAITTVCAAGANWPMAIAMALISLAVLGGARLVRPPVR